ncbi:hypothetical protein BACCIP111883_02367 [Sutcliffiella rhizosphaerae]|uniref:Uncharacterized protein n=1 Tax=Sutcliffiella rhizosphaerae TaxID=2880967 RepID=A0ABM8YNM3_9BACI|nr:hypothetical protein BACCIP111883_02367 [Sutcliffiella rhizosphaerae]
MVKKHFLDRFLHCKDEKNYTLVRHDILEGLKKLIRG